MNKLFALAAVVFAVFVAGCASPDVDAAVGDVERDVAVDEAYLSGRICNAHVGAYLAGAVVRVVDEAGDEVGAVTDDDGAFFVVVRPGLQVVSVQDEGFSKTFVVEALAGADVSVQNDAVCAPAG